MSYIKGYVTVLLAAVLSFSVLSELSPRKFKEPISLVLGLLFLFSLVAPLPAAIKSVGEAISTLPEISDDELSGGGYYDTALMALEEGVRAAVSERFSLDSENIRVEIYGFDVQSMSAQTVYLTLSGKAAFSDYRAIEDFVEDIFKGEGDGTGARCIAQILVG